MTLPSAMDSKALLPRAVSHGVAYVPGTGFHTSGGERHLRLSFSHPAPRRIREGVRNLAALLHDEAEQVPLRTRQLTPC
ncbi:hypothetical protein ACFYNY_00135 [Streptomyces sp. NPDC006530]|uniref:hypothetical protein n=1 Tax=Streptomyces sp. NPDC006530 TaxID=3364750 RepID=UPI0036C53D31